jgi:urease accessory protein
MFSFKVFLTQASNAQDREGGPTIFAQVKNGKGVDYIVDLILSAWRSSGASQANPQ